RTRLRESFESGAYASALERTQAKPSSALFTRVWQPGPLVASTRTATMRVLIFSDRAGLGAGLADRLRSGGHSAVTVEARSRFMPLRTDAYGIDPDKPEDHARLLQFGPFTHIVHAWSLGTGHEEPGISPDGRNQPLDTLSLLKLVRALGGQDGESSLRLIVLTRGIHAVHADDP